MSCVAVALCVGREARWYTTTHRTARGEIQLCMKDAQPEVVKYWSPALKQRFRSSEKDVLVWWPVTKEELPPAPPGSEKKKQGAMGPVRVSRASCEQACRRPAKANNPLCATAVPVTLTREQLGEPR